MEVTQNQNETPTLTAAVQAIIENRLGNMHTCLPGVIKTYDTTKKTANIQPSLKRKYQNEDTEILLPIIPNVPVCFPQTTTSIISVPLKVGDDALLIFSERSLDIWKSKGGVISPEDTRKFDLSDAFAIPAPKPIQQGLAADAEDAIRLENTSSLVRLHEDGKIEFSNTNGSIVMNTDGSVVITTPAGVITMASSKINLGTGAEPVLKGATAETAFNSHTHPGVQTGGGSTGTPSTSLTSAKSSKVFTE